jgi:hypothetical protein
VPNLLVNLDCLKFCEEDQGKCRELVDLADNISELHGLGMFLLEILSLFYDWGSESPMAFHVWKSDLNHIFVDFLRFTGLNQRLLEPLGTLLVNEDVSFALTSSSQLIFDPKPLLVMKRFLAHPTVHSEVFACLNRLVSSIANCYFLHESGLFKDILERLHIYSSPPVLSLLTAMRSVCCESDELRK